MLLNPAEAAIATSNLRDVETAARAMRLQIQVLNASTSRKIDEAFFLTIARDRPDALFISSGPLFTSRRVQLAHLATRHAVPTIHGSRLYPEFGGLITYGASLTDAHHQAGIYSGRILKGEKPADMPGYRQVSLSWSSMHRPPGHFALPSRRRSLASASA
jgi:putative ABC transport system substrate-binding protein